MWSRGAGASGIWLRELRRRRCSAAAHEVVETLRERGLVEQTSRLDDPPPPKSCAVYVGFDPTADSLHTGNLLAIIALIHFQRHSYQPIAVIGGATGQVGDPSGRTKEREGIALDILERNKSGLRENLSRIFHNVEMDRDSSDKQTPLKILDNADWLRNLDQVQFVSDIGRHFRVGIMLSRTSVRQRLESDEGMSFTEFSYPLFQAQDFLHLHKNANCWIQLGGGDQFGNISTARDFIKRVTGNIVHGITVPILTTSSGEKLGKSAGNAVWLSPEKTSPYQFYQHFVRTPDGDVERLLKLFTFKELDEIQEIMNRHKETPERFEGQKCLAESVTRLVHGDEGVQKAKNATAVLFGDKEALKKLTGVELVQLFNDAPCHEISYNVVSGGTRLVDVIQKAGIYSSLREAEIMVRKGGLYVNHVRMESIDERFSKDKHVLTGDITVVRIGKKNYNVIKWKP